MNIMVAPCSLPKVASCPYFASFTTAPLSHPNLISTCPNQLRKDNSSKRSKFFPVLPKVPKVNGSGVAVKIDLGKLGGHPIAYSVPCYFPGNAFREKRECIFVIFTTSNTVSGIGWTRETFKIVQQLDLEQ